MADKRRCGNCRHFKTHQDGKYEKSSCWFNPPAVVPVQGTFETRRPEVTEETPACGRWEERDA